MAGSFRIRSLPLLTTLSGWPRRVAALCCLMAAVLSALSSHRPAVTRLVPVVVAARGVAAGASLAAGDVRVEQWPATDIPATAVTDPRRAVGRRVGAPMARGEPITRARLLDTAIADALGPGQVASTVLMNSPASAALLQAGSVVDLYAAAGPVLAEGTAVSGSGTARVVATGVTVLSVLPAAGPGGAAVVIATDRGVAAVLASHASDTFLATLVPPS